MRVDLSTSPILGFPNPVGAHELAWSYLLDAIFADAFHAALDRLVVMLPHTDLLPGAALRATLSRQAKAGGGTGVALLGSKRELPQEWSRLYVLDFGALAPASLRSNNLGVPPDSAVNSRLSVFGLRARLAGIPIRLASLLRRPDLHDRYMYSMRSRFAPGRDITSFYQLTTYQEMETPHAPAPR